MRGFSKAIIAGNLTRDPELRNTPNGASVCSFAVAVNRVFRDQSGAQKETVSYIDCSAWGKLGETIAQYAKKGTGVIVSGRLDQRSWEDKTTGQKRSRVEVVVEDFVFADRRESSSSRSYSNDFDSNFSDAANSSDVASPENISDIPTDIPEGEIDLSEVPF